MSDAPLAEVVFTSEFKRSLRRLAKRYRSVRQDLEPLVRRIAWGETPGDRVQGVGAVVYKARVANSDARRGTSGGYRVLYYVPLQDRVVLLTVYSKSDQGDVSADALRRIIAEGD